VHDKKFFRYPTTVKRNVIVFCIAIVTVLLLGVVSVSRFFLPDTIRITEGQETTISYADIFSFHIHKSEKDSFEVMQSPIRGNQDIQISYPDSSQHTDTTVTKATISLFGILPVKTVTIEIWDSLYLVPLGQTIGIDIHTNGVMILGTGSVETAEGKQDSPAKGKVFTGDLIQKVNGQVVESNGDVTEIVEREGQSPVTLEILREGEIIQASITPLIGTDGIYKLGLWIRDRAQGIGSLTYYNPDTGGFGAIGHGIADVDTHETIPVGEGTITKARISAVKKGVEGEPGEIEGSLTSTVLGEIQLNSANGVYGTIVNSESLIQTQNAIPIALKEEIKEGKAYILCNLEGDTVEQYEVKVSKTSKIASKNDGLVVEITDPRLLEKTNGIIQGMSGSPIIQDGALIGAVTHVFVQEPQKGYGIYIEDMINTENSLKN